MRKELLGAVVIFGLGAGGAAWAQDTTATPPAVEPTTQAPATTDSAQSTTGTETPSTDGTMVPPAATDGTADSGTMVPSTDTTADTMGTGTMTTDTMGQATDATTSDSEAVATTTEDGETVQQVANDHMLGSDYIGADIIQSDGTSIGEISDLVIDPSTHVVKNVVIDIGGFLGIGTKTVTLPVEDLTGPNQDGDLQVGMTREQIEALPDFVGKPDDADQVPAMSDPAVSDPAVTDPAATTTVQ